jgi:hypothetical protein
MKRLERRERPAHLQAALSKTPAQKSAAEILQVLDQFEVTDEGFGGTVIGKIDTVRQVCIDKENEYFQTHGNGRSLDEVRDEFYTKHPEYYTETIGLKLTSNEFSGLKAALRAAKKGDIKTIGARDYSKLIALGRQIYAGRSNPDIENGAYSLLYYDWHTKLTEAISAAVQDGLFVSDGLQQSLDGTTEAISSVGQQVGALHQLGQDHLAHATKRTQESTRTARAQADALAREAATRDAPSKKYLENISDIHTLFNTLEAFESYALKPKEGAGETEFPKHPAHVPYHVLLTLSERLSRRNTSFSGIKNLAQKETLFHNNDPHLPSDVEGYRTAFASAKTVLALIEKGIIPFNDKSASQIEAVLDHLKPTLESMPEGDVKAFRSALINGISSCFETVKQIHEHNPEATRANNQRGSGAAL